MVPPSPGRSSSPVSARQMLTHPVLWMLKQERLRMLMKPGHTALPAASITTAASPICASRADPGHRVASDPDVGAHRRAAGALIDLAAGDQDVRHQRAPWEDGSPGSVTGDERGAARWQATRLLPAPS